MGRYGYRYWYYATGLPRWARSGFCPGRGMVPWNTMPLPAAWGPVLTRREELDLFEEQAEMLEEELKRVRGWIEELKNR